MRNKTFFNFAHLPLKKEFIPSRPKQDLLKINQIRVFLRTMSLLPTPILGAESLSPPPPDVGGVLLAPEWPELGASPPEDEGWAEESKRRKEVVSRLHGTNKIG